MIPWNDRGSHRIKSGTTLKCFVFIQDSEPQLVSVCVWVRDRGLYEGQTERIGVIFLLMLCES